MGFFQHFYYPRSFFGVTTLRNGVLILALLEFIFIILTFLGFIKIAYSSIIFLIALICSGLGVYGVMKNKPKLVFFYYIYVSLMALAAVVTFVFSLMSFNLRNILINLLYLIVAIYNWRVVSTYYHQMKSSREEAAVVAATEAAIKA